MFIVHSILLKILFLVIKGDQKAHIIAAKSKIDTIVKRGRLKQSVTHFISLPMINETVIDNYLFFKVINNYYFSVL